MSNLFAAESRKMRELVYIHTREHSVPRYWACCSATEVEKVSIVRKSDNAIDRDWENEQAEELCQFLDF